MHRVSQPEASTATPTPTDQSDRSAGEPRTWTFINRHTGEPVTVTCMRGCTINHSHVIETPSFPEDIFCWTTREDVTLPVNTGGAPEEFRILGTVLKVEPFSPILAQRLPYAVVEMVDDHFVEALDPDCLATVINTLAERLQTMRETHARLVTVRAEYRNRA